MHLSLFFFFLLLHSNYSRALSRYINNTRSSTLNYCLRRQGQVYAHTHIHVSHLQLYCSYKSCYGCRTFDITTLKYIFLPDKNCWKASPHTIKHCMNKTLSFQSRKWRRTRWAARYLQRALWWITKDETTAVPCFQEKGRNCALIGWVSHWTRLLLSRCGWGVVGAGNGVWASSLYHLPRLKNKSFYTVKEKRTCNLKHLRQYTETLKKAV